MYSMCAMNLLLLGSWALLLASAVVVVGTSARPDLPSSVLLKNVNVSAHRSNHKRQWTEEIVRKFFVTSRGSDGEFIDASNHFFWGESHGVAMELGAVDGIQLSETLGFEKFGWNRILVEANPKYIPKLRLSRYATVINAAICDTSRTVHFYSHNHESGIVEMASHLSVEKKKKHLETATAVECLPLSRVFAAINVTHVNFFVLDVEGAELSVLQSIDWDRITFDVLSVETEPENRRKGYAAEVASYLLQRGYEPVDNIPGRNSWFKRTSFVPSRRPTVVEGCYSGALWATRYRNKNNTQQTMFKHCPAGYFYNDGCQNCAMIDVKEQEQEQKHKLVTEKKSNSKIGSYRNVVPTK